MANIIQIKRSTSTAVPTTLANGELAFTSNGNVLFVGANSNVVPIGGARNPGTLTANQALVANSTSAIDKIIVANLVPSGVYANGSFGSNGFVLTSNGTTVNWTSANDLILSIDSLEDVTITSAANNNVLLYNANTNQWVNLPGQRIGTTDSVTFQDIIANGNTTLGSNSSDIVTVNGRISSDLIPSANSTHDIGTAALRFDNVYGTNGSFSYLEVVNDLTVNGDLIVSGNLVTQNVSSLEVVDPLIKLAVNNETTDTLFIGFIGHYGPNTNHTGLFRSPDDKKYYLMGAYDDEAGIDGNIVDVTDPSFQLATMKLYINSGGLFTNATSMTITANSTWSVGIQANTLSLSTPLPATSGGIGFNSYATGDVLVAANATHLSKLTLGVDGKVLQSNGTTVVYADLDGGTF